MTDINKSLRTFIEEEIEGELHYKSLLEDYVGWVSLKVVVNTNDKTFYRYTQDTSKIAYTEGSGLYYNVSIEEKVGSKIAKSEINTQSFTDAKNFFDNIFN